MGTPTDVPVPKKVKVRASPGIALLAGDLTAAATTMVVSAEYAVPSTEYPVPNGQFLWVARSESSKGVSFEPHALRRLRACHPGLNYPLLLRTAYSVLRTQCYLIPRQALRRRP